MSEYGTQVISESDWTLDSFKQKKATHKQWRYIDWDECPECGDAIEAYTSATNEGFVFDGDDARCMGKCEATVSGKLSLWFSVDEDGSAWLSDNWNEVNHD